MHIMAAKIPTRIGCLILKGRLKFGSFFLKTIKEITTFEDAEKVVLKFKDIHFLRAITSDDKRAAYINKHLENGHFLVANHNDTPAGFVSFYSNDLVNKIVYITALGLDEDLVFLKGKIFSAKTFATPVSIFAPLTL